MAHVPPPTGPVHPRAGPARAGVAAAPVAGHQKPRAADRQRHLPDDRPPRAPVRSGCVPVPVRASLQPHLAGPRQRRGRLAASGHGQCHSRGIADDQVVVLDPAMGTGTFLQSVLDRVADIVTAEGGDVPANLRMLLTRLIGFERQIGPYAVAELKLDQALDAHHAEAKDEDFRLHVADTLDDPNKTPLPTRAHMYAPLADSRRMANRVKTDEEVMVVLGNPPYRSKAKPYGKWVLDRNPGQRSLLDDFREPRNGKHEHKLHDLAIYFWRWALWKAFESTPDRPGIIAFITTNAYLTGQAFTGMRRYLRRQADFGWIIDLSTEGHWSSVQTRVFPGVPHPVCIGIFARGPTPQLQKPAQIKYLAISGSREEKFGRLESVHAGEPDFLNCPDGWIAPFKPIQDIKWTRYPRIDDLLPCTSLGVTCNRAWVHGPEPDVLAERWRTLIRSSSTIEKRQLMKETRDRTIDKSIPISPGGQASTIRRESSIEPNIERIGFRSFDRQYLIADQRVVDFLRPDLWRISGAQQVYLVTQMTESLTSGPAAVFTPHVPDTHYMHGRGGRVIPLYRDTRRMQPNADPRLLALMRQRLRIEVGEQDLMAYVAGVIAHSGYTSRFRDQPRQPSVRVPLTQVPSLWREAVLLGAHVIWLHTYGERLEDPDRGRPPGQPLTHRPKVLLPISGQAEEMPDSIIYDDSNQCLVLGSGRIGPVSLAVWQYEVSGCELSSTGSATGSKIRKAAKVVPTWTSLIPLAGPWP